MPISGCGCGGGASRPRSELEKELLEQPEPEMIMVQYLGRDRPILYGSITRRSYGSVERYQKLQVIKQDAENRPKMFRVLDAN